MLRSVKTHSEGIHISKVEEDSEEKAKFVCLHDADDSLYG